MCLSWWPRARGARPACTWRGEHFKMFTEVGNLHQAKQPDESQPELACPNEV